MAENIKVICRVRPLNEAEKNSQNEEICSFCANNSGGISIGQKTFTFDHALRAITNQQEVYELAARPIVADVLNGYNGTIFAYGQTCSGKTHTMEGVLGDAQLEGIVPRICADIFSHIEAMSSNLQFCIKVSYFEIYLEKIRDLLDVSKTNLPIHENKNKVPYVKDITEQFVCSHAEVMHLINKAKRNRHVAETNMNERSSRSHAVLLVSVSQENLESGKKLHGSLYLVDLAGSEKVSKSGAHGSLLTEAKHINRSLSALGNVINALVERNAHVPYRDSKLTRVLQQSLGGNAKTTVLLCCSPAAANEPETRSTLAFGTRAKSIQNTVIVNEEVTAEEWRRLFERECNKTRSLAEELAAWRSGVSPPTASPSTTGLSAAATSRVADQPVCCAQFSQSLYAALDEKEEEIHEQAQLIERLRAEICALSLIHKSQAESVERLRAENSAVEAQLAAQHAESNEIMAALEELAERFEKKEAEVEQLREQNSQLLTRFEETTRHKSQSSVPERTRQTTNPHRQTLAPLCDDDLELQKLRNLRHVHTANIDKWTTCSSGGSEMKREVTVAKPGDNSAHNLESCETENLRRLAETNSTQTLRNNTELRRQLDRLERRLQCGGDRVTRIDKTLCEARENAIRDRNSFCDEMEQLKELLRVRTTHTKIIRPIRGGN